MSKVLIVTGASKYPGIGAATAKLALDQGWNVVFNGRSDPTWESDRAEFIQGDITDHTIQNSVIDAAIDRWGRIDGIVHNAALIHSAPNPTSADWMEEYAINVIAPYELTCKAKTWLAQAQGAVVMIGSRSGLRPNPQNSIAYTVSKSAMHCMTRELAVRFAPIRFNAVAPGLTLSARQLNKWKDPRWKEAVTAGWEKLSLLPGFIEVTQIAEGVYYLLTAPNVTGHILEIDNGVNL